MQKIRKFDIKIDCPIFSKYKEKIKKLNQTINGNKLFAKKVDNAQEMLEIINILLSCPKFNEEKESCKNCRFVLHLSEESSRMIIDMNKITS